jgi:hypothetical protein
MKRLQQSIFYAIISTLAFLLPASLVCLLLNGLHLAQFGILHALILAAFSAAVHGYSDSNKQRETQ